MTIAEMISVIRQRRSIRFKIMNRVGALQIGIYNHLKRSAICRKIKILLESQKTLKT